jgi:hypothetical protein
VSSEVLEGLACGATEDEAEELGVGRGLESVVRVGEEVSAVAVEEMEEEGFGVASGYGGGGFGDGVAEVHGLRQGYKLGRWNACGDC